MDEDWESASSDEGEGELEGEQEVKQTMEWVIWFLAISLSFN